MIHIAYNHKGEIISIVNTLSKELAIAYWHGAGLLPHSSKTEKDFDPTINGTGVVPILRTYEIDGYNLKDNKKVLMQYK